jgi:ElaB/YqjD/DUF883 family membrane-anchored ribosome-binding protein
MPHKNTSADNPLAHETEAVGREVIKGAHQATESIASLAKDAAKKIDAGRSTAAEGLDSAASTIHDRADDFPGGAKVREFAHAAADRMITGADYVRSHDVQRMVSDVETVVRNNPGPALAIAAVFGFVLGRALTRD